MSQQLRTRLRFKKESTMLQQLLNTMNDTLVFVKFVNDIKQLELAQATYEATLPYENEADFLFPYSGKIIDLEMMLLEYIKQLQISKFCYISIHWFASLPWSMIDIIDNTNWFLPLWQKLPNKNISIIDTSYRKMLIIAEGDHDYEIFFRDINTN